MKKFIGILALSVLFVAAAALKSGDAAPDFSVKNQDGKTIQLSDLKGKYVLLYFYPKDDTPGCTKEACKFRDGFDLIKRHNVVVLGVSKQSEQSHRAFKKTYHLPFDLIVDEDGKLATSYSVETIPVLGFFKRESVLISPIGKVLKFYKDVDPEAHARQVIQDVEGFQGGLQ